VLLFSNLHFFGNVRRREALKNDSNSVQVFEVFTSSVVDVEPLGRMLRYIASFWMMGQRCCSSANGYLIMIRSWRNRAILRSGAGIPGLKSPKSRRR